MEALERYENTIERLKAVIEDQRDQMDSLKGDIEYARKAIEYMISETSRNAGDLEIVGNMALNYLAGLEGEDDE